MKELKTYISEGFFSNVGANTIVKPVIDAIKDASINDKVDSGDKKQKFVDLLTPILKDLESNIKKGKIVFEYTKNDKFCISRKITITLKITDVNAAEWIYSTRYSDLVLEAYRIALYIATDLFYESAYPIKDPNFRHSIANTIKVTEFKVS